MITQKVNPYIKATFFYIVGNGFGQGLMLLSTIVFTRIMSKEGYGQYSTYYSFVAIMTTFIGASLNSSINNAYIDFKKNARDYRASILFLATIIAIGLSTFFLCFNVFFGNPFSPFLVIMACLHSFSFLAVTFYNNSATMENKYIKKCILLILPNLLQITFSITFLLCLPVSELNARVIGSTLGVGVCAVFVYTCMIKGHREYVNKMYWKYGLKISLPLIFSAISYSIMSQSDNIMITAFKGADVTAVYSLIYYVSFIIYAVMEATNPVLQAWLYRSLDENNVSKVRLIQKWYLFIYAVIAIGITMVSPELIKLLSPESYWEFNYIGPFVLSSYLMVMYSFYSMEITFFKKTIYVAVFVSISSIINIILNSYFIPFFGGIAAAIASTISYLLLFFMFAFAGEKMYKRLYSKSCFLLFFLIIFIICMIFELIYSFTLLRYILFSFILIMCFAYVFIKRAEVLDIIKKNNAEAEN